MLQIFSESQKDFVLTKTVALAEKAELMKAMTLSWQLKPPKVMVRAKSDEL